MRFRVRVRVRGFSVGAPGSLGVFKSLWVPPPWGLGPAQDPKNMRLGVTSVRFRVRVRVRGSIFQSRISS